MNNELTSVTSRQCDFAAESQTTAGHKCEILGITEASCVTRDQAAVDVLSGVTRDQALVIAAGGVTRDQAAVTAPGVVTAAWSQVVLSLFPGIDLLGMGFEQAGYCVVRGPDLIFGGDIRCFHAPPGVFAGIIAGSPCQDFSMIRRTAPTGYGKEMLDEFVRVVCEARPEWWLLENVPAVPNIHIDGYSWQRIDLRASEFGLVQRRLRHFQFGSVAVRPLIIPRGDTVEATEACCMATEGTKSGRRTFSQFCQLQGLPADFSLPSFKMTARYRAVGNGVPVPMAYAIAKAIKESPSKNVTACACSCGRVVTGKAIYATAACRKRAQRRREGGM